MPSAAKPPDQSRLTAAKPHGSPARPHGGRAIRTFLRLALVALGLTELYALLLLAPLLHPRHMAVYHWTGPAHALFLPVFLDLAILWLTVVLLLCAARRGRALLIAFWSAIFLLTPWTAATEWQVLQESPTRPVSLALLYAVLAALLLAVCLWHRSVAGTWRLAVRFASTALFFFGIGGSLLLAQLAWFAWQARALNDPTPLHESFASSPAKPRILWIVFDELSYQQIYERRYPGLALPAFDALAAQSTVFTHAVPAGIFTDNVLPALMSGAPIDTVRSSPAGALSVHHSDTGQWQSFDPRQTVFKDAHDAGYRTAVAGWYIPYCRLLSPVLDSCFSSYAIGTKSGMSPQSSLAQNMLHPFTKIVAATPLARFVQSVPSEATLHIADYRNLTQAAQHILEDRSATFVLLHLPIPHFGGIYNRATGQLTTAPATYLDNLALADRCLSELRSKLEQTGQWNSTTVVLMGDHSWRTTQVLKPRDAWSTEEEKASHGGVFDDRPAYLVKLPDQHSPATAPQPFPAINTRILLDALLRREIKNPEALAAWLHAHH